MRPVASWFSFHLSGRYNVLFHGKLGSVGLYLLCLVFWEFGIVCCFL